MNLRIVYRTAHEEASKELMLTGIGRMREQFGVLDVWVEGQHLALHPHLRVPICQIDFYESDCRELPADEAVLYDQIPVHSTKQFQTLINISTWDIIRAVIRRKLRWLRR